jgi:hypothetical protein
MASAIRTRLRRRPLYRHRELNRPLSMNITAFLRELCTARDPIDQEIAALGNRGKHAAGKGPVLVAGGQ